MSRKLGGFTIVEVIITMAIASILLTLGVFGVRNLQAQARDEERAADVAAIARGLEERYVRGNSFATATGSEAKAGSYPGVNEFFHMAGFDKTNYTPSTYTGGYVTKLLPGTSKATFISPSGNSWDVSCVLSCQPAGDTTTINNKLLVDRYVYEAARADNSICCCGDCTRFTIYWKSEVDGAIHKVTSKR